MRIPNDFREVRNVNGLQLLNHLVIEVYDPPTRLSEKRSGFSLLDDMR